MSYDYGHAQTEYTPLPHPCPPLSPLPPPISPVYPRPITLFHSIVPQEARSEALAQEARAAAAEAETERMTEQAAVYKEAYQMRR